MLYLLRHPLQSLMSVGLMAVMTLSSVGCQSAAGTGALVGGAAGAGIGAIIGNNSHGRTAAGAAIGGAVGAISGAIVGNEVDKANEQRAMQNSYPAYPPPPPPPTVGMNDVVGWSNRGVRDEVIMDRIDRSGAVFHLSAADENYLRDQGVSEVVIRKMEDTDRRR